MRAAPSSSSTAPRPADPPLIYHAPVETRAEDAIAAWLAAAGERHLADRTLPEVRRALQALSGWYVERRGAGGELARGAPFSSAGKRAAYALFYGPLHLLTLLRIVDALDAARPAPREIVDLGCGTGAAGAAWALAARGAAPPIRGVDESAWAVRESRASWHDLGLAGRARRGSLVTERLPGRGAALVLGWTVNELRAEERERLRDRVLGAAGRGARVLVVEPIARSVAPWWDEWVLAFARARGRADTWRFPVELPEPLRTLDRAAGLDHRVLTARSLYLPSS